MIGLLLGLVWAQTEYVVPQDAGRLDAQVFRQSLDAIGTMWTNDASMRPSYYWTARASLGYMRDPLVFQWVDGHTARLVRDAVNLNVAGTVQLWRLRLGLELPVYLFAAGDEQGPGTAGLGSMLLDLKGTVLDHDRYGVGLALAARVGLPTQTLDIPLGRGTAYEVEVILDGVVGGFVLAANVGHRGVPRVELGDQVWDDQLMLRAGVGYRVRDDGGVSLDVASSTTYGNMFGRYVTPVELMIGGWARLNPKLVLRGGIGTGLTDAIGSPAVRALMSVAWQPTLWKAEPEPAPVFVEPPPPVIPGPGRLGLRALDVNGAPVDAVARITHISVPDGVERPDGPTQLVTTGGRGEVTLPPGRVAIIVEAEGFLPVDIEGVVAPDQLTAFTVPMTKLARKQGNDRITITEQVFFDLDKSTIKMESFDLLREVAFLMEHNSEIRLLRIEGHTDSRGSDPYNFRLSNDRAESVLEFLVAQGVERSRVNSVGYGERRPLDPRENEEAWALNRRVDFFIERWEPEPETP